MEHSISSHSQTQELARSGVEKALVFMRRGKLGGLSHVHIPEISEEEVATRTSFGEELLSLFAGINFDALPADLRRTVLIAQHQARCWSTEERHYWVAVESTGNYRSLFAATAAMIGEIVPYILDRLGELATSDAWPDIDLYMDGCENLARSLRQMATRTRGQAARGIFIPQLAYRPGIELIQSLKDRALASPSHSVIRTRSDAVAGRLELLLKSIEEGFVALQTAMGAQYREMCPAAIGIGQYPDGEGIYEELVYHNTTTEAAPRQIHDVGLASVSTILSDMDVIARKAGFSDAKSYRAFLSSDSQWRSSDPAQITALFETYMARMDPLLDSLFHQTEIPRATPRAAPLPEFLEATLAYGIYEEPRDGHEVGSFLFNASTFGKRPLFDVAAFCFHELMPGHHLHLAGQRENLNLHEIQRLSSYAAFNEGWAEYGRRLAEENQMYEEPAEAFGGLCSDMRQATRLVVDTGANVLGWSTEEATQYLSDNLQVSDTEIEGMLAWYACEIPGQSLTYSLGHDKILSLRAKAQAELGASFDLKDFHRVLLDGCSRPFVAVERDVNDYIEKALRLTLASHETGV